MMNIEEALADIERRINGLKANRPARINQIHLLQVTSTQTVTLAAGTIALFEVRIACAGAPIADVSYAGFSSTGAGIIPSATEWSIQGDVAVATCEFTNTAAASRTSTLSLTAWALNGLSATFRRR